MKRFFRYLYDCRYVWVWAVFCSVIFAVVFALYGIKMEAGWYPILLSALLGIAMLIMGFVRRGRKHRELERVKLSGEILPDISDMLPQAGSLTEEDYQTLPLRMEADYREKQGEWDAARQGSND